MPTEAPFMADTLTTVGSFPFLPEAEAARMHLEEAGIPAFLSDAETVNMDWFLGNAIGYVKLQVPSAQAKAARSILQRIRTDQSQHDVGTPVAADTAVCLACGAELPAGQSTCAACGWSYASDEEGLPLDERAQDQSSKDSEPVATESTMDTLRSWKRPVLLIFLSPLFVVVVVLALALLTWFAKTILP
jgi:hypothetical protein